VSGPLPPQERSWADLLDTGPQRGQDEVTAAMKRDLGMDVPRAPRYRPDAEALRELEEGLGLR
jgi:hypothetical protein